MRGMSTSPAPPTIPEGGVASPPVGGITSSRRRAYPTAHLAANSVSYSGGFDPGAQAVAAGGAPSYGAQPMPSLQEGQAQLFTPGAPEPAPSSFAGMQPSPAPPGFSNGQAVGYPGAAGGMAGLSNQFSNMGMGGSKGVSTL